MTWNSKGFDILCTISNILNDEYNTIKTKENLTPDDLFYFKYTFIIFLGIELSFQSINIFET